MSAQAEFDQKYISSSEIRQALGLSREALLQARRRGRLPEPVRVDRPNGDPHVMLWLRDEVSTIIDAWRAEIADKRAAAA